MHIQHRKESQSRLSVLLFVAFLMIGFGTVEGRDLPEIRTSLGMRSDEVEKKSLSAGIKFSQTAIGAEGFRTLHALIPHRFVYDHPDLGFTLPEAKGISMASETGRVEQIDVNPQLTLLNVEEAIERCRELVSFIRSKGLETKPRASEESLLWRHIEDL